MTRFPHARPATLAASLALVALTALAGCERRQSDVPAPTPSSPTTPSTGSGSTGSSSTGTGTTTPGSTDSTSGTGTAGSTGMGGSSTTMPSGAASDPMSPASAASR